VGVRLNYIFTVGGDEWGSTIYYNARYEENRNPWFRWGVTDHWSANPRDTYWRGDYDYIYTASWALRGVWSMEIGGTTANINLYLLDYEPDLPSVFPLVKGAERLHTGRINDYLMLGITWYTGGAPEGRGTYERRVYVEDFEELEAGGETYRCAKVQYSMRHTVEFLSPHYNEDWGKIEWVEEGYRWYTDFGLVKADVTIKTYWWDELEETERVRIELTGATLP
jgi:hypothetical protein